MDAFKEFLEFGSHKKACVIAIALSEEKYEILNYLDSLEWDEKEEVYEAAENLKGVYEKLIFE